LAALGGTVKSNEWLLAAAVFVLSAMNGRALVQDTMLPDQDKWRAQRAPSAKPITVWATRPSKLPRYVAANQLLYRLSDVLGAHKGELSWVQPVFASATSSANGYLWRLAERPRRNSMPMITFSE